MKDIIFGTAGVLLVIAILLGSLTGIHYLKAQTPKELATYWLMPAIEEPWTVEVYRQDVLGWRLDAYRADVCIDPNQPYFWCYIDKQTMLKINVKIRQVNYTDFAEVVK